MPVRFSGETRDRLAHQLVQWTSQDDNVEAIALAGDDDGPRVSSTKAADVLLVVTDPTRLLKDVKWTERFGDPSHVARQNDADVTVVVGRYGRGEVVRFTLLPREFIAHDAVGSIPTSWRDRSCRLVFDPAGNLGRALLKSTSH